MLQLQNLSKSYGGNEYALKQVSFTLEKGQVVSLIGPSGAGKSTLIRCVNRMIEPSAGKVVLNGDNITEIPKSKLRNVRRRMGMIFQEYALIDRLTVMENVLSGRLGYVGFWRSTFRKFGIDMEQNALALLETVGLSGIENKRADALSGGQKQRVGIARALIQDPDILLVDEPTASLDPKTARQVMRLIRELCIENELAAIINIHDVALAQQFVERVIGLRDGQVVYDGPPDDLTPDVLTQIYGEEDWSQTIRHDDENIWESKI